MGPFSSGSLKTTRRRLGLQNEDTAHRQREDGADCTELRLGYCEARSRNALGSWAEMQRQASYQQAMMGYRNQNLNSLEGYRTSLENSRAANADVREQALKDKESQNTQTQDARTALGAAAATMLNRGDQRSIAPAGRRRPRTSATSKTSTTRRSTSSAINWRCSAMRSAPRTSSAGGCPKTRTTAAPSIR